MVLECIHAFIYFNLIMRYLNLGTMGNCSIWVFFQTLLKITTITYNGCLMRNEEGFWIIQANYLQVHTCKVTRCASFSCLFSYGVGSIQGLTEIYSRHTEKLARLFTLCLKQQSFPRLIWSLARLLEFKMAWGLLSSVTWDALTFRNFVQDLLCIKLRSLCDSKYGLKNCHNTC